MPRITPDRPETAPALPAIVAAAFTLTGATGLVLQVVWQRQLALLFGTTIEATGAVLAAFLGSLALGSALLGGRADRSRSPIRFYAVLEIATGLGALASLALAPAIRAAGVSAFRGLGGEGVALTLARCLLAFVLVGVATVPMGGTLPALAAAVARHRWSRSGLGLLYGLNTLGAAAGALLAGFVLILALGIRATWILAALIDIALGVLMWWWAGRESVASAPTAAPPAPEPDAPARGLLALAFTAGAVVLGLEVLWTRSLVVHFGSHVATFALVLAMVLTGLGAGALVAGRLADSRFDRVTLSAAALVSAAIAGLAGLVALRGLSDFLGNMGAAFGVASYWGTVGVECLAAARVVLLPTFLAGLVFPLLLRETHRRERAGREAGRLVAASTAGTLVGSLGTALVLVPALGAGKSFVALLLTELAVGGFLLVARAPGGRTVALAALALAAALALVRAAAPVDGVLLAAGVFHAPSVQVLHHEDGLHGLVTVEEEIEPGTAPPHPRWISVNGVNVAGTTPDLIPTQKLQAHLPLFLHGAARTVLHIGVGSGGTAASALLHPLERLDVVELNPRVPPISDRWFRDVNRGVLFTDPRLKLVYGDGRTLLLSTAGRYDVILSDSIHPRYAGNGALYTRDYYEICRSRLEPGGVVSQWLPIYSLPPEAFRMIVRAFLDVFPDATLWYLHDAYSSNTILIGARDGTRFDTATLRRQMAAAGVAEDLAAIGIRSPEDLLSNFFVGRRGLERLAAGVPAHTDDRPLVEYSAGRIHGERFAYYRNWTSAQNLAAILAVREPWRPDASAAPGPIERKLRAYLQALEESWR